jgi:hypothetical protein
MKEILYLFIVIMFAAGCKLANQPEIWSSNRQRAG